MKKYSPGYRQNQAKIYKQVATNNSFKPRSIRKMESKAKRNIVITIIVTIVLAFFAVKDGLPAFIGGLSVFNSLKPKTVVTTEDNEAVGVPILNIPFEATSSATISISGFSTPNSKVEIYLDDKLKDIVSTDGSGAFKSTYLSLSLGTNNIYGKTVLDDGKKSLPSKTIRLIYNNEKPKLEISEPQDGIEVTAKDKRVKVAGKTDSKNSVKVNGMMVVVNNQGDFETYIVLNEGENVITITTTNGVGNSFQIERRVTYISPTPTPTPTPSPSPTPSEVPEI